MDHRSSKKAPKVFKGLFKNLKDEPYLFIISVRFMFLIFGAK